ncbi:hypothetical protein Snoj_21890 [Streptomyces nojiriensis]|uniref:Uncharacterized protein n=1 Tax=Streptomyces nojiriensis TaxID=66374 RepID=A0ABQ3SJF4_9ACTN|nr:hypothetical protein GCM10010205_58670 [Streptomyces nojiriensis]GHI68271.1 hypothetical protein Snoj_21890 [Streptomyces nojiriensis]
MAQSYLPRGAAAHGHTADDHVFDLRAGRRTGGPGRGTHERSLTRGHPDLSAFPQVRHDRTATGGRRGGRPGGPRRAVEGMSVDHDYGSSGAGTQVPGNQCHAIAKLGVHERTLRSYIEPLAFT